MPRRLKILVVAALTAGCFALAGAASAQNEGGSLPQPGPDSNPPVRPVVAKRARGNLPSSGVPAGAMGLAGLSSLEAGYGLVLVSDKLRRRR